MEDLPQPVMNYPGASTNSYKKAAIVRDFDDAITDMQSAISFEDTLHVIALQARLLIGTHQSAISYIPDENFKLGIHTHSFSNKYKKYNSYDAMPTGKGIIGLLVENRRPLMMTQAELVKHYRWKKFSDLKDMRGLEHPPMNGWLAAPVLRKNGDFVGYIQLSDKIEGEFTDHDLELFTRLAELVAPTFELQYVNKELQQEVEERKQAVTELAQVAKRSRVWLENSPVCTKIVDLDYNLQYMSNGGIKSLGIEDITQFYGKPYPFEFYPESFKITMTENLDRAKETGETITQEASVVDMEGNDVWFHSTLVPVNDDKGKIDYIMIVSVDTTERKQAEAALKETQTQLVQSAKLASIGQIAAGLAHEISQPLGVIRGRADLTKLILEREQDVDKDMVTESLDEISAEVVRASKIIKHLKIFSRQEKLSEHVETDINWLIDESFTLMNKTLQLEGIDVQKELTKGLPQVLCDYVQIEQVFTNLVGNAKDALQESTEKQLVVRSYRRGNNIFIDVEDTGPGIPKTIMEKVFDPFFTTKLVGQGTGLGLSISLGIIQEHNGTLAVNSKKGEGTCFTISLPITA